jgi:uncharacterized protein (TIGR02145 family)
MQKYFSLITVCTILVFSCKKNAEIPSESPLTVTDADGNVYATIKIGTQIWMKENLKTTKYNDGTQITKFNGNNWFNLNSPTAFYQWADTLDFFNLHPNPLSFDYYGAMYNHLALESGKLAPAGWRIPCVQDFLILKNHLSSIGYANREALALKSSSSWAPFSKNGIDAVGFNGLPNGYVSTLGTPTAGQSICTWATTDVNAANGSRKLVQLYNLDTILIPVESIAFGAGIRCIKE